jgi:REP element-mobilizing transposase RayT
MPTIYRRKSHCVFLCDYRLVFPTKYRRMVINDGVKAFIVARFSRRAACFSTSHVDVMMAVLNEARTYFMENA